MSRPALPARAWSASKTSVAIPENWGIEICFAPCDGIRHPAGCARGRTGPGDAAGDGIATAACGRAAERAARARREHDSERIKTTQGASPVAPRIFLTFARLVLKAVNAQRFDLRVRERPSPLELQKWLSLEFAGTQKRLHKPVRKNASGYRDFDLRRPWRERQT